jgi:hypothetical protein
VDLYIKFCYSFCRYFGTDLLVDLQKEPGSFKNFCRISSADFEYLLNKIGPYISKNDLKWGKAIPAKERLAVTLRFLVTGDSFQSLYYFFRFSSQVILNIVLKVCKVLIFDLCATRYSKDKKELFIVPYVFVGGGTFSLSCRIL